MKTSAFVLLFSLSTVALLPANSPEARADDQAPRKKVNIDRLKRQYWNQGGDLEVVQNRVYAKAGRPELGIYAGWIHSDPFVAENNLGASLGYYFSETLGIRGLAWKNFSRASSALQEFENESGYSTNTNKQKAYYGGEGVLSAIYGKLSLLNRAILYYDLQVTAGLGVTQTENGNYFTQSLGLSQLIFISSVVALRADYRYMHYHEDILGRASTGPHASDFGKKVTDRDNWSSVVMLGFNFFF